MVKLSSIPSKDIISQYRGTIDFASTRGQAYARAWPRKPAIRNQNSQATADIFNQLSKLMNNVAAPLRDHAHTVGFPFSWTWKDVLMTEAYFNPDVSQFGKKPPQVIVIDDLVWRPLGFGNTALELHLTAPSDLRLAQTGTPIPLRPRTIVERGFDIQRGYNYGPAGTIWSPITPPLVVVSHTIVQPNIFWANTLRQPLRLWLTLGGFPNTFDRTNGTPPFQPWEIGFDTIPPAPFP